MVRVSIAVMKIYEKTNIPNGTWKPLKSIVRSHCSYPSLYIMHTLYTVCMHWHTETHNMRFENQKSGLYLRPPPPPPVCLAVLLTGSLSYPAPSISSDCGGAYRGWCLALPLPLLRPLLLLLLLLPPALSNADKTSPTTGRRRPSANRRGNIFLKWNEMKWNAISNLNLTATCASIMV
jgi:hypothetical protein